MHYMLFKKKLASRYEQFQNHLLGIRNFPDIDLNIDYMDVS